MKIVHYIPFISKSKGGVPAYMALLARDLGKLCELHVLTHRAEDDYELECCTIHYIDNRWLPWNSCKNDFLQLLADIQPDVFHTNACWDPLTALTAIWAKQAGFRVVFTPHGELTPYSIRRHFFSRKLPAILLYQHRAVRIADLIHTTSTNEKEILLRLGWNKHLYLVPNCIQVDQASIKTSWQKQNRILFISRIHHKKGIHFLLEAVAALRNELTDYQVCIVGQKEDTYYDHLVDMTKELHIDDIVAFHPPVYEQDKWQLFRSSDMMILPTYSENFSIVVAESLLCGTPVITTIGAPWEELETYHCGWWIEIGTAPLVKALRAFLACEPAELQTMGENGRQLVEQHYSSQVIAQQFITMYNSLLHE